MTGRHVFAKMCGGGGGGGVNFFLHLKCVFANMRA